VPAPAEVFTLLLTQTATVYARGVTGSFDVVVKSGLACRLLLVNVAPASSGGERSELAGRRVLCWDAAYTMPQYSQVDVEGLRWNLAATNAFETLDGPDGTPAYKRADVVRAP
jgi:hypothetical protein